MLPRWIKPQLARLVDKAPDGADWLHEIKLDGYRMHARIERGRVQLLTRTGLDWSAKYPRIAEELGSLPGRLYLDGEVCAVRPDGVTSFALLQPSSANLVFFVFDLLWMADEDLMRLPLRERKARLEGLLRSRTGWVRYHDHREGEGPKFLEAACGMGLEGIVSKPVEGRYLPGDRRAWLKVKCLNREEFVVVGYSDPEGSRHRLGSLLLAYYAPDGRLVYAGRAGTGFSEAELERLWRRLQPLHIERMPLSVPPPRATRFGSPLVLSRVHWVRPEIVVEVTYLTWTEDGLLRHVVYRGVREDKPAREIVRSGA